MSIRKTLIASSASTLMLFGISQVHAADLYEPALPDLSAVMSMYGGGAILDSEDGNFDAKGYMLFGGDARVAGRSWQAEMVGSVIGELESTYEGSNYFALAGHWLNRGADGTMGVFGGVSGNGHQDDAESSYHAFGGIEYAMFNGNTTLFGQVGGIAAIGGEATDTWESGVFGRGGWRYFFTENSKVEVDAMIGWGYFNSSEDSLTAAWGAEYEHQFSSPFSAFAAYRGHFVQEGDGGPSDEVVSHAFMVGLRIDLNSATLLDRDRTGAGTFNIPDFHRAVSWPDDL